MPWSRSGRRYPRTPSVISLRACPTLSGMHTSTWGPYKLLSTILSCCNDISATSLPHHFFTLIFRVSLDSALCRLIIFIPIKRCGVLSFLTHYPVHISIDIQHDSFFPLRSDVFSKCSFNFLSSICSGGPISERFSGEQFVQINKKYNCLSVCLSAGDSEDILCGRRISERGRTDQNGSMQGQSVKARCAHKLISGMRPDR